MKRLLTNALCSLLLSSIILGCYNNAATADPAVTARRLTALLHDPDPGMRKTAAQALGKIGLPDTAPALLESLNDIDPSVREMTAWALGNLGEDVLPRVGSALIVKLDDPVPAVKLAAAQALGALGGTEAIVAMLTNRLRSPHLATRRAAVRGLLWLDTGQAAPGLMKALYDEDAQVRQVAVAALGERVEREALSSIQERLLYDKDAGVRGEAAYRLGKFGDWTVVAALRKAVDRDPDPAVRHWAVRALEQIGTAGPPS